MVGHTCEAHSEHQPKKFVRERDRIRLHTVVRHLRANGSSIAESNVGRAFTV